MKDVQKKNITTKKNIHVTYNIKIKPEYLEEIDRLAKMLRMRMLVTV